MIARAVGTILGWIGLLLFMALAVVLITLPEVLILMLILAVLA